MSEIETGEDDYRERAGFVDPPHPPKRKGRPMKIYVASSWKNRYQPQIVELLRMLGHMVYDFRNPPDRAGFGWEQVSKDWKGWTAEQYRRALNDPLAIAGYNSDIKALKECDAAVYVLPCGKSASWELGYAMGQGKLGYVVQFDPVEPELMFKEAKILTTLDELEAEFTMVVQEMRR